MLVHELDFNDTFLSAIYTQTLPYVKGYVWTVFSSLDDFWSLIFFDILPATLVKLAMHTYILYIDIYRKQRNLTTAYTQYTALGHIIVKQLTLNIHTPL